MQPNQLIKSILFFISFFVFSYSKVSAQKELVTFSITSSISEGKAGDTITYQINTKNFKNVLSFQLGLEWDSSLFKVVTNNNWIALNKNKIIQSSSFNIFPNRFLLLFLSSEVINGDSLTVEDSTLITFKLMLKKNGSAQNVCFSNKTLPVELSYYEKEIDNDKTTNNCKIECNKLVLYSPKVNIYEYNNRIYAYDTLPFINIQAIVLDGVKPYKYHWGGNFGTDLDRITIPNPQKDTVYKMYVTDALNDTSHMVFYIYIIANYKLEVSSTPIYYNYFTPTIKLAANIKNGTPPYKFLWNTENTVHSDSNSIEIENPQKDFRYSVYITDSIQNKGKGIIIGEISKMNLSNGGGIKNIEFRIDDDKTFLQAKVSPWFNPIMYKWEDGATTTINSKYINRPLNDSTIFRVSAFDKDNHELKDSVLLYFNKTPYLVLDSYDTVAFNNSVSFSFSSNPNIAQIEWRYEYSDGKQMFTKSGVSDKHYFDISFDKLSGYGGEVIFYYKLLGVSNSIVPEQSVRFRVKTANYYLSFINKNKDFYVCDANKKVVLKAYAKSSMPNDVLYYDWGEYGKGYNLDSIEVYLSSTKVISLSVYGRLNTKISDEFTIHFGEKDNFTIKSIPNSICEDLIIKTENVKVLNYKLQHCSKDFKVFSESTFNNKTDNNIFVYYNNLTPNEIEYVILKIDQSNTGLCLENNYHPYIDTIQMNPSPKLINQLKCVTNNDSTFQFNLNDYLDPNNLNSYKLNNIRSSYIYTNGSSKSNTVKQGMETANSELKFLKDTIGENNEKFYSKIELLINSKYEENGCASDQRITINKMEKLKMFMFPKYQTVNTGDFIDTFFHKIDNIYNINLGIWEATAFILDYDGMVSNSLKVYNPFSTYKVGQLYNHHNHPQIAKFIIYASYLGCKIDPDTAYITVNPLYTIKESDLSLTESNEFIQGKIKIFKDDLEQPIDFEYYPNPVQQVLNIQYTSENPNDTELAIYDKTGKLLENYKLSLSTGKNHFQIDMKSLVPNSYILHLRNKEHSKTIQFIKN